jgi:hypothetical protein
VVQNVSSASTPTSSASLTPRRRPLPLHAKAAAMPPLPLHAEAAVMPPLPLHTEAAAVPPLPLHATAASLPRSLPYRTTFPLCRIRCSLLSRTVRRRDALRSADRLTAMRRL